MFDQKPEIIRCTNATGTAALWYFSVELVVVALEPHVKTRCNVASLTRLRWDPHPKDTEATGGADRMSNKLSETDWQLCCSKKMTHHSTR